MRSSQTLDPRIRTRACPACSNLVLFTDKECRWCRAVLPEQVLAGDWRLQTKVPAQARLIMIVAYTLMGVALLFTAHVMEGGFLLEASILGIATAITIALLAWAQRISTAAGLAVQQLRQAFAQRYAAGSVSCPEGYVLYLRPFEVDGRMFRPRLRGFSAFLLTMGLLGFFVSPILGIVAFFAVTIGLGGRREVEEDLANAFSSIAPMFALSAKPGMGSLRLPSSDLEWQGLVERLARDARAVIIVPGAYQGTLWEFGLLAQRGWLGKTVLVCPPAIALEREEGEAGATKVDASTYWDKATEAMRVQHGVELPPFAPGSLFIHRPSGGYESPMNLEQLENERSVRTMLASIAPAQTQAVRSAA